ncbi:pertactin-like passenger domain-containing protein, partial [Rhodanobacter sp. MP7CTX1]|uniref:beta strand repeat-containing protein n=1 Tax=Rhodanobacter sp. MP7CTX1 TaxID=2723084 RepID=UPI0016172EEB
MNANTNGRLNKTRHTPNLAVAPVTRAIRSALAISATLLALGGSGAAIAQGTCTFTTPTTVSCDGAFTTTVPGTFFTPIDDLTLVLGDTAPTSVTPAAGLMGIDANWSGNVRVFSYADITTVGASGIFAYGSTSATVFNEGSITTNVTAPGAKAMDVSAYGGVTVINGGPVNAYSTGAYDVTTVSATAAHGGDLNVINYATGTITATAQDGNAIAVNASAYGGGVARVGNDGAISASSVNGIAIGVLAQSDSYLAFVDNLGSITATSTNGQSVGVLASGTYALVENSYGGAGGSIAVTSGQDAAIGIEAYGQAGARVFTYVGGSITATSNGGAATGVLAQAFNGRASVINGGSIQATSLNYSPAVGVEADSLMYGTAYVGNTGSISATAVSGNATAILAQAQFGRTKVVNAGDLTAVAGSGTYYQHNRAIGIVASSGTVYTPGNTEVINSGGITATGPSLGEGIEGSAGNGDLLITNTASGTITASSPTEAIGIGTGQDGHNGFGRYIDEHTYNAVINNAGTISANADGTSCVSTCSYLHATGIQVFLNYGNDVTVTNSGAIAVSVLGGVSSHYLGGEGIDAVTYRGDIAINNSGRINVAVSTPNTLGTGTYDYANWGINAESTLGEVSVVNSGDISVTSPSGASGDLLSGINVSAVYGLGVSTVVNSGTISVTGDPVSGVSGIDVHASLGSLAISNSGDITVDGGSGGVTWGIFAQAGNIYSNATVTNSGRITVDSTLTQDDYGIQIAEATGHDVVDNSGSITVTSTPSGPDTMGIQVNFGNGTNTPDTITNSGDIAVSGGAGNTFGVYGHYQDGNNYHHSNLTFNNSGSISASFIDGHPASGPYIDVDGVRIRNGNSATTVSNSGSITATMSADPLAGPYSNGRVVGLGVLDFPDVNLPQYSADGTIAITNTGSIAASLTSNGASFSFFPNDSVGVDAESTYNAASLTNTGSISATAQTDASTLGGVTTLPLSAVGLLMETGTYIGGGSYSLGDTTVNNSATGSVTASSTSNYGGISTSATGIETVLGRSSSFLVNAGNGITISNAGLVSATAAVGGADTLGSATAIGISVLSWSDGFVDVTNIGVIKATATSPGMATAAGLSATGYNVAIALNAGGYVGATATGASGSATGLSLVNSGTAALTANNDGVINATFNGAGGKAYGAMITSAGDLAFTNTGHILASNATSAVGVDLTSPTNVTLTNSGTITTNSAAAGSVAVLSTDASNATLNNSGTINGAIQTGSGNDILTNDVSGIWNAVGTSDFGAGDDTVSNAGTINLSNTTISLGSDPAGNQFGNTGLITVVGSNTITMDTGTPVNPNPFTNNGTINFRNGAANNTLTIAGNFAGNGQLDMDVNGANGTGDQLKITGNVAAGSVSTVNVNLLTDPTTASTMIPLVQVGGTAAAGAFVLGTFTQPKGFLGLSEALVSTPNLTSLGLTVAAAAPPPPVTPPPPGTPPTTTPPPVTPPPSSIGVGVTVSGLSQLGTLAASAAPGVQSLMNSQVGTLEDRMGAVSQTIKGGLSLWTRAFADSGTVSPDHSAGNFGQNGNFGFD